MNARFDPPYDSPIERDMAYRLSTRLHESAEIVKQFCVTGADGKNYRLDFMVEVRGRRIGIECDGKQFHDAYADYKRDVAIVSAGNIAAIYRFRGQDIFYNVDDAVYVLSLYEPEFFSIKGARNALQMASDAGRLVSHDDLGTEGFRLTYPPDEEQGGAVFDLRVTRTVS